jgi:hypothetical protein
VIDRGGSGGVGANRAVGDQVDEGVADQDVVDELAAAAVDPAEPLRLGDRNARFHSRAASPWSGWS